MREPWEAELERLESELVPTLKRSTPAEERALPKIPNLVSTVTLLQPGLRLPLADIARRLPHAQYAPRSFAACIFKMRDSVSQTTALVFAPGSMVVVGSRTRHHAIYRSFVVAMMLGHTRFPVREGSRVVMHRLGGRLRFDNFEVHNQVGHGQLDHRVDLRAMCDAAPLSCTHYHDLFPGLTCKVWLTRDYTCHCGEKGDRCKCVINVLVFKTGHVVIPGCRTMADINSVFYRVCHAVGRYREDVIEKPLTPTAQKEAPRERKRRRRIDPEEESLEEELRPLPASDVTPLMRMADAGRLADATALLELLPALRDERDARGRTALERLEQMAPSERTPQHVALIVFLKNSK